MRLRMDLRRRFWYACEASASKHTAAPASSMRRRIFSRSTSACSRCARISATASAHAFQAVVSTLFSIIIMPLRTLPATETAYSKPRNEKRSRLTVRCRSAAYTLRIRSTRSHHVAKHAAATRMRMRPSARFTMPRRRFVSEAMSTHVSHAPEICLLRRRCSALASLSRDSFASSVVLAQSVNAFVSSRCVNMRIAFESFSRISSASSTMETHLEKAPAMALLATRPATLRATSLRRLDSAAESCHESKAVHITLFSIFLRNRSALPDFSLLST
mmetsp:Transcript_17331/g.59256  ORF Transcript_17331/g.59256 Transcript_17331/m.59256 type:complete len:274 (-) Transcript_17331:2233-3054(-)